MFKPVHAFISIKQLPVFKRSPFSCPVIENFIWIDTLLRDHLSYKTTLSLSQRWPLNTSLTVYTKLPYIALTYPRNRLAQVWEKKKSDQNVLYQPTISNYITRDVGTRWGDGFLPPPPFDKNSRKRLNLHHGSKHVQLCMGIRLCFESKMPFCLFLLVTVLETCPICYSCPPPNPSPPLTYALLKYPHCPVHINAAEDIIAKTWTLLRTFSYINLRSTSAFTHIIDENCTQWNISTTILFFCKQMKTIEQK